MRGKKVAILESRLGPQLADLVAQRGGVPFHAPALAELPDLDPAAIGALVRSLEERPAKAAVFQTGVGTKALFSATDALGLTAKLLELLSRMVVAVRGPKPTAALRARGVRIDRSAADPFTTREVLECMKDVPVRGERVIVQRYGVVNGELDKALEARGASVIQIPTYRLALPPDTRLLAELIGALERGEMDAAVFTNAEQVRNLFAVAGQPGRSVALRAAPNHTLFAPICPQGYAAMRSAIVQDVVVTRLP